MRYDTEHGIEHRIENIGGLNQEKTLKTTKKQRCSIVTTQGETHPSSIQTQLTGHALVFPYKLGVSGSV